MTHSGPRRRGVRVLSWVVLGAGALLLLYVVYVMAWTNVRAGFAVRSEVSELQTTLSGGTPAASQVGPELSPDPASEVTAAPAPPPPVPGEGFALMYVPRLGRDWVQPIIEGSGPSGAGIAGSPAIEGGVGEDDLRRGVVHYPRTALPGQVGNFAVAGHRATNGEPFRNLDRMREGDAVVVLTGSERLTYRVTGSEIVTPRQVDVLAPVPMRPDAPPAGERLTLTTCHPRWSSELRLVVFAVLADRASGAELAP